MSLKTPSIIAVLGAGTMGHGIAHVAALAGHRVVLQDPNQEALEHGLIQIEADLQKGVEKGKTTLRSKQAVLDNLLSTVHVEEAVREAAVVIEAAPENLDLKQKIFGALGALAPSDALLGTNTSSLPIGTIAEAAARPERVIGMHFFNPVPRMPLLEIVRGAKTGDAALADARELGAQMGKECIVVQDSPGFATSRLGVVLGLEAMRMLEQGVAQAEDIDKAMTLGYRHPVGPLKLTDMVGLDVRLAIAEHLHSALGSEAFRPPRLLREKVAKGELGKKSGQGFYRWDEA